MAVFVTDEALDYRDQATSFPPGGPFLLDEAYRRAHLPLVAPDHPGVIAADPARGYRMGRHVPFWSLVIPVAWPLLAESPGFRTLDAALRNGPLAAKISWDMFEARKAVLHATICGGLAQGTAPAIGPEERAALDGIRPFDVAIRGLFSGSVNRGRLYLRLYPERIDSDNAIHSVQAALGRPLTALYVLGLYNLVDDLRPDEAGWLAGLLDRFADTPIAIQRVDRLWLMGARDDLALDSEVAEIVRLG
ncbi:MAG: hypothetical protein O9322_10520 [Beijerinckiaceae bacterium]|nr:hypothetical protein [Beijerinckiaceae bacterium]MCZ8299767.1 hypothetical protein [Beijerinckiaceae bacterium]